MTRAPGRPPSMADVAALAGVSHQTVWRALNSPSTVRESTRLRVLEVAAELGYRRNLSARQLATNRSMVVGVLGPATPYYGPSSCMYAVERAVRQAGYHPLLMSAEPGEADEALDRLLEQSAEALIVIAPYERIVRAIDTLPSRVPIIVLQAAASSAGTVVAVDQAAGIRSALDHLVGLGHTRIQHIAGPTDFTDARLRAEAFAAHCARLGTSVAPELQGDWSAESGYAAARLLDPLTTAVLCANDQMAMGVLHGLAAAGRRVPDDVSVVGFDDMPESAHTLPPLTTVHQDFEGIGRRAVEAAMARLGGEERLEPLLLAPRLVIRASTAVAPSRA